MGAPRPDLRRTAVPLGPVIVFAASNFPFAFSVAGGDTASALAAGCPVIIKPAPQTPLATLWLVHLMRTALLEAEVPESAVQLITGGADVESILAICPFREADCLRMIKKLRDSGIIGI